MACAFSAAQNEGCGVIKASAISGAPETDGLQCVDQIASRSTKKRVHNHSKSGIAQWLLGLRKTSNLNALSPVLHILDFVYRVERRRFWISPSPDVRGNRIVLQSSILHLPSSINLSSHGVVLCPPKLNDATRLSPVVDIAREPEYIRSVMHIMAQSPAIESVLAFGRDEISSRKGRDG